jgi:CSLREA domain-containing protein
LRSHIRVLVFILVCATLVALASVWPSGQKAQKAKAPARAARAAVSANSFLLDKGGIRPAASTIVVNSTADVANGSDGLCTLREAIIAANTDTASGATAGECAAGSSGGADLIDATGVTGTIDLTTTLPSITASMTINGPGASLLTIQRSSAGGTPNFGIFVVQAPGPPQPLDIYTFSRLTISNGNKPLGNGGALLVLSANTINVTDCILTGNSATRGAGIYNTSIGFINVINTAIRNNLTLGDDPSVAQGGVAIYNASMGSVNVVNSTLNNNTANGAGAGGGIYNTNGFLTVTNSTISNNSSLSGGGIYNDSGTADINNCTVVRNTVSGRGGGIGNFATFRTRNSIIALNTGSVGNDFNINITSQGHNLIGVSEFGAVTPASGDLIGTTGSPIDPLLGARRKRSLYSPAHPRLTPGTIASRRQLIAAMQKLIS